MQVVNRSRQVILMEKGVFARSRWSRLRGLIGRSALGYGEGLIIPRSKSIHTFGMRFAIDILFLDRGGHVIHLFHSLPRGRFTPLVWKSAYVLELATGVLRETGTELGDWIVFLKDSDPIPPEIRRGSDSRNRLE